MTEYFGRNGATPLVFAAAHGQVSCIQFLLKNNADVNSQNKYVLAVIAVCCSGCELCV